MSSSTSSFLAHCLAYASHASIISSKFWCHENETGSLNFGPLLKDLYFFILHDTEISCQYMATWNIQTLSHGLYKVVDSGKDY